jgi:hypothetical protein
VSHRLVAHLYTLKQMYFYVYINPVTDTSLIYLYIKITILHITNSSFRLYTLLYIIWLYKHTFLFGITNTSLEKVELLIYNDIRLPIQAFIIYKAFLFFVFKIVFAFLNVLKIFIFSLILFLLFLFSAYRYIYIYIFVVRKNFI